jgi:hypothetical protein
MAIIDINARIIPEEVRCWRLFPGSSYRFLDTFLNGEVAFLDMPGFIMPDGKLSDAKDLARRIRVSEITLDRIAQDGKEKEHFVSEHDVETFRVGRKRQRNQQAMINFFDEAEKGDLIITPEPLIRGRVHIGMFVDAKNSSVNAFVPRSYGVTSIPARKVQWLKSVEENKLSSELSGILRQQHPFSIIEKSQFFEIFSLAFDSYVYKDRYSSVIFNRKDDYTDRETSLIGLVSSLAANFSEAVENGEDDEIDTLSAILDRASIEFHCSQAADIHSPGFNRFTSGKPTALVIAAVFAALSLLAGCDSKGEVEQVVTQIEYVNSSAEQDDDCTATVSKTTDRLLKTLGSDNLWKMCQAMKDAETRAGLESSAKKAK